MRLIARNHMLPRREMSHVFYVCIDFGNRSVGRHFSRVRL